MAQTKIVLVDQDEEYLSHIEKKMIDEFSTSVEMHSITDIDYLKHFFSTSQSIDILVINAALYTDELSRHNIANIFLLTEEPAGPVEQLGKAMHLLYKYTSAKEIFDTILHKSGISHATLLHSSVAKVILVYSPAGGLGQTTLAAGLCAAFSKNFRRALYIGMDNLQTAGVLMQTPNRLQPGVEKTLLNKGAYAYDAIKPLIVTEYFDILPPFSASLPSLAIETEHLLHFVEQAKNAGDYDYIVLDAGRDFTQGITKSMAVADQTMLVTAQDAVTSSKFNCLLDNIDCSDTNRFVVVCNKYIPQEGRGVPSLEYIEYDEKARPNAGEYLAGMHSIQKLAQLFM